MLQITRLLIVVLLTGLNALSPQAIAATQTVCATPNALIPDNNIAGVSYTLTVADPSTIYGLRLKDLSITHQHIGELTITLKHGDRVVKVLDKPGMPADKYGCTGKNFSELLLSDAASHVAETECTSTDPAYDNALVYKPNEPLSAFDGMSAAGEWTLIVTDNHDYNQTVGNLKQWCLEYSQPSQGVFFSQPAPGTPLIFTGAEYPKGSVYRTPVTEMSGKDSLLITNVLITQPGNATADFSITQPKVLPTPAAPLVIQPGQVYSFEAQCKPTDVGLRTATFEIHTNLPAPMNHLSYPLQCDGKAAWFESNTPPSLDFGKVAVGDTNSQSIQLAEAKGATQLKITRATLVGANKGDFHLDSSKLPITILQKGRAELPVTCQPTAGGLRTAKLVLTTNAPNALSFSYELKCLGDAAVAIFSPAENSLIAIEKVRVNKSKTYKIGVRNAKTATTALKLYDYQLISSQNTKLFKLISQPSLIEVGGSGNIDVVCDAEGATPGNYSAKLRFATNDPKKLVIEYTFTCSIEQSKPLVSLSPAKGSKISFDRIQQGAKNKIKTITLENAATASEELELSNPSFSGDGAAAFSIVSIPIKIGIGLTEEVQVQCNADKTGSYTATLTLMTNDPEQPTLDYPVSCEVSNTVAPLYDSQPAPNDNAIIELGNVVLNTTSPAATILIKEIGNDTLRVQPEAVALTGANAKDFKVISPNFPLDIADEGAPVPLTVTCQPSAMGVRTATLNLVATDIHGKAVENFPHPQYQLQCTGYLPIYNSVNYPVKGDIDLGINSIGQSSKQSLTIKNTGNGDLIVDKDKVLLTGKETESFQVKELPVTIPAGKAKSLSIQCAPTVIGNLQAQLNLVSNDPQLPQPQYTLKCTGQEAVGASYSSKPAPNSTITLDATLGSTATALLVIQEVGTAVLDVGQNSPLIDGEHAQDFSLDISDSSPFTGGKTHFYIPDGTPERTLQIRCKPTGEGQRKATLRLTSNDVAKPEISYDLVCNSGAVSAGYQSSPVLPNETIDCGTVQVGQVATRHFEIEETANADLIVDLVTESTSSALSGSHPTDFKVLKPSFPIAIKDGSGERKTVTIQCQPSDMGIRTATLQLTTNDLSRKTVTYPLQVIGSEMLGSQLTLQTQGKGQGRITSSPQGVQCSSETLPSTPGQLPTACVAPEIAATSIHCDAYFNRGTQVTLTPQPEPGSVFVGWNPECANGIVNLEEDTTCIAEFADAPSVDSDDLEIIFLEGNDLDFGTVPVGTAVSQTLTVKNKTARSLVLESLQLPPGLLLENTSEITLSAGQTVNIPVHLDTTQPLSVLGQLSFNVAGKRYQFAARAKVVLADDAQLTVSYPNATELDFGALNVGETATREVMIKNNALQSITLSDFALPPELTGNMASSVTLEPQQTVTWQLTLKPVVEGMYAATWSFTAQQKVYNLRAKATIKTSQLANGCYAATRLYVNSAATGQATGLTWTDAFSELHAALNYANQCDTVREIWVAKGIYRPTSTTDRTASFKLRQNLALYGGFAGAETALSERNLSDNVTILSGDIGQPNVMTDNSYHVVTGNATDATTRFDGFNVTAGQADAESDDCGGGMWNDKGSPKVVNVTFSHNYAKQGGGMCNENSSHPVVKDVVFNENQAVQGAGLANLAQSNPILARVSFTANQASQQAGALYNDRSSPVVSHSVIQDNQANEGGAMVNIVSQAFYSHLIIHGNIANRAAVMLNRQSEPRLNHVTISGNAATTDSGIVNVNSRMVIQNSILWDNHAVTAKKAEEPINDDANSRTVISHSIVQSTTFGKGTNKNKNPLFIKPVDFSAATLGNGDLHLQATSPAIDMGNNDNISSDLADIDLPEGDGSIEQKVSLDVDYQPRVSDGNGDGKLEVDAGAYEYSAAPAVKYSLTVNKLGSGDGSITSSIAGIKCGATCTANYLAKTRVTLQVKPTQGIIFAGWTGDCQGSAAAVVVELTDNKQCTAHFEPDGTSENHTIATCEISGGVAKNCDAGGNSLKDITIYGDGNVQNAALAGRVTNQGWLTNATIKPQAIVTGGKLTGAVLNKGELQDIEFYGSLLSGGALSGTIVNKSPKGVIRDVQLAAAATLKGGRLAGKIIGDPTAPARVSNVIIAAGSSLQNIVLDGTIVIEHDAALSQPVMLDVQLAPNTQIIGGKIAGKLLGDASAPARLLKTQVKAGTKLQHVRLETGNSLLVAEKCQQQTLSDAQSNAPELANLHTANEAEAVLSDLQNHAIGINSDGQLLAKVATLFTSRIITDNGEQANKTVLSRQDAKSLKLAMTVRLDAKHVKRAGEVLVAVAHTDEKGQSFRYMKTDQGWALWDGQVENLQPLQSFKQLPEQIDLSVFAGDLSDGAGQFEVYTGYRLKDGTVVYNGKQAMRFSVLPALSACDWGCSCAQ